MSEYSPELSPYNAQVQQASNHTERLVAGVASLALGIGGVRAAATGSAADFQQMTAGMAAAATVTHQSTTQLQNGIRGLTREFPVARGEAVATVRAIQALGLTAKGQEGQVASLAKTMTQLSGATGEAPAQLALGFGQLTREMASLDPKRVQAMADSLTSLSARSGTSPTAITTFAKAIGPMAQAAGVGETSVLGISTSFAKLGDDGYVAANAVSKMFSDLNRSVRDGGTEMAGYANAVGMTVDQFKALYNADPARAVAQVTQAIGKMPSAQGQRTLDQLGIEGQRAQRAFLEQAQSGGMMADINAARQAYGSGSTAKAAGVGFGTTQAQLTRLGNAAQDVAITFERPLLNSVNSIIGAAAHIAGGIGAVARSGPVGGAVNLATELALPLTVAHFGARALRSGAMASFLLRSGPVTGFLGGIRAGRRGGLDEAVMDRARSAPVRNMLDAAVQGQPLGIGYRANLNERAMQLGAGFGAVFPSGGTGAGLFTRLRGAGVVGAGMVLRSGSELMRLARTDPLERDAYLARTYGSAGRTAAENIKTLADVHGVSSAKFMQGMAREVDNLVVSSGKASTALGSLGKGLGSLAYQSAATAGSMTKVAGAGMMRALGPMLIPAAVIGGGMFAYNQFSHRRDAENQRNEEFRNQDIYGAVNAYRDAMGKTGEASTTLADQLKAASDAVGLAVVSFQQASQVGPQDASVVQRNKNVQQYYSGTEQQVASQVKALDLGGLQPSDVQGAKYDLMRLQQQGKLPKGFDINQALTDVGSGAGQTLTPDLIKSLVSGAAAAPKGGGGFGGFVSTLASEGSFNRWQNVGARTGLGMSKAGGIQLSKEQKSELGLITGALGQEQASLSSRYGSNYATGRTLKDMNEAIAEALKHHNADLVVGLERSFSAQLGLDIKGPGVTAATLQNAGSFTNLLADRGIKIGGVGVNDLVSSGSGKGSKIEDSVATTLQNMGSSGEGMAQFFSNFAPVGRGAAAVAKGQKALAAADQAPEDLQKQHDAVMAIVDGGQKAGMSLGELAAQAARSTNAMSDQDARAAVMVGVINEAQRRLTANLGGMTIGQRFAGQTDMATRLAGVTGQSKTAQDARAQGQDMATSTLNDERTFMQQRIMVQRNFEIQSSRAWRDYHTQVDRENTEFQLQQSYTEQDFYRQRARANRDFNIQRQQQIQDAAKTLYDPYTRIQVRPVWDSRNLVGNEQEQITAMRQQLANIGELRKLGLSQTSIDQLSLYDPSKAQQVAELVADLRADHSMSGQLNQVSSTREALAGQMTAQDPTVRRAKAAFQRQLRDNQTDYNIAVARQRAQFATQMQHQQHDFQVQLADAAADIKNADKEITGDMTTLQADMNKILHGQAVDWTTTLKGTLASTIQDIKNSTPKLIAAEQAAITAAKGDAGAGKGGVVAGPGYGGPTSTSHPRTWTGSPETASHAVTSRVGSGVNKGFLLTGASTPGTDMNRMGNPDVHFGHDVAVAPDNRRLSANAKLAQQHAANYGWNAGVEWAALFQIWQQESQFNPNASNGSYYGIPQGPIKTLKGMSPAQQIDWGLDYIWHRYGDPLGAWAHKSRVGWYDQGGIATTPHIGVVAEAGHPEAMIPLNSQGISVLAEALRTYLNPADAAMLRGGGASYAVHISHDTYTYDSGQHIHGPVTVKANSPAEWAKSATERARANNLTAPRSVRWAPSAP